VDSPKQLQARDQQDWLLMLVFLPDLGGHSNGRADPTSARGRQAMCPAHVARRRQGSDASVSIRVPDDSRPHLRRARDYADRNYADALDLETLAAVAGMSKYHFQRLFTATYGVSATTHLSRRRIERAQDLLRSTNLTITEVCHAVGFSSLGSFSSRFRELVGCSPREFQRRYGEGAPHIPGCYIFMRGLVERSSAT
jgi:AraC-like DNA-binding protein